MSTNGDFYSFGILLLKMITGKRPTDDIFHGDPNVHNFAQMALPVRVTSIVDKSLLNNNEDQISSMMMKFDQRERDAATLECLISAIKIRISCSSASPQHRMSIHDVAH